MEIVFNNPVFLWFLLAIPVLVVIHFLTLKYGRKEALRFSNFEAIARITKEHVSSKAYPGFLMNKNFIVLIIKIVALCLLIFAVAGTILLYEGKASDFDFILAIDASSSMLADDFSPNRLEATKVAANLFIDTLAPRSRVGIVTFAGTSFIEQKLTEDSGLLKGTIDSIKVSKIGGTDLATAIITSTNLLSDEDKGGVIILLTDGQSNVGASINDGVNYANKENVMVHTIGVGTEEGGRFVGAEVVSKLDEDTLEKISGLSGGEYFRADSKEALVNAYQKISGLNIRKISLNLTPGLMLIALILLILEWVLIHTRYRIVA